MSNAIATFDLELPRKRAIAACQAGVISLNWELLATGADRLTGRQDPARLCCHSAPVEVEILLTTSGGSRRQSRFAAPSPVSARSPNAT